MTFIVEEDGTGFTQPVSGTTLVFVNSLYVAGYENEGAGLSGETVYEPLSGWYERGETYRITDASGEVHADADTNVVTTANVSWEVNTPAESYVEYVLVGLVSDEPTTYRITFEFDSGDSELERPSRAGEANSSASNESALRVLE